jgi:DNA-binding transcriptional ArsR family regulator
MNDGKLPDNQIKELTEQSLANTDQGVPVWIELLNMDLTKIFEALSDPARYRLVLYLAQNPLSCASDIGTKLDIGLSTMAQRLRKLHDAGLLIDFRRGPSIDYRLNPAAFEKLTTFVSRLKAVEYGV